MNHAISINSSSGIIWNPTKAVGLRTTSPALIPFTHTKILSYLCVKEVRSFNWTNCIRGVIHRQVIVAYVDHQVITITSISIIEILLRFMMGCYDQLAFLKLTKELDFQNQEFFAILVSILEFWFINLVLDKNVSRIRGSSSDIFDIYFQYFYVVQ